MSSLESPKSPLLLRGKSSGSDDEESALVTHSRALGITCSSIIRGAVQMGSLQVILPMQMDVMFPHSEAHMLALCVVCYGASKFCEPVVALLCDHWVSPYGRRLPLYLIAHLLVFTCLVCMGHGVLDNSRGALYTSSFIVCMFGINAAEVPYHGIIADEALLRPHTTGMLSGYKNAWFLMGAAAVQFSVMMSIPVFSIYILQIISVPVFVGITIMSMRVKASHPSEPPFRLTLRSAIDSYKMTPATHGMMFWIIIVYFIASAGLQWERYLYYFVRDCISPSQALAKVIASRAYLLCMVSSACACACYSALSHLTRTIGNCRLFVTSLLLLAGGTALLIFVDTPWHFMCVCLLFGISSGLMLSAAFALAVENIPAGQQESLSMCLFRMYGSGMANLCSPGLLLAHFGHKADSEAQGFNRSGYTAMLAYGMVMLAASAAVAQAHVRDAVPSKE